MKIMKKHSTLRALAASAIFAISAAFAGASPALDQMTLGEFVTYPVVTPSMANRAALLLEQSGYGASHAALIAQLRGLSTSVAGTVFNPLYASSTGETAAQRFERHQTSYDCEYMPYPYDYLYEDTPPAVVDPWPSTSGGWCGTANGSGWAPDPYDYTSSVDPGYSPTATW
jgi:hypothetical protein